MAGTISPIYDTELENVKSQLAYADALRKKSIDTGGQMIGNIYVAKNPWQNFVEGLAGAGIMGYQRQKQGQMEQAQEQQRQNFLAAMPSAMETAPQFGPTPEGGSLPDVTREKSPEQQAAETRAWAAGAPRGMESVQQFALQQAMTAPQQAAERRDAAQARADQQSALFAQQKELQTERLEQAAKLAKERQEAQKELRLLTASMAAGNRNANADLQREILEQRLEDMKRKAKEGSAVQQKEAIAADARKRTLDEAMTNVDILLGEGAYEAGGGVLPKATGSGAGKMVDVAAGFFGRGTEGAKNAAKIGPLANPILMQVPRFEGPQSDADTRVYKEAAGQLADSSLPVSVRMSAAKTVKDIMVRRKGQFGVQGDTTPAAPTGPVNFESLK